MTAVRVCRTAYIFGERLGIGVAWNNADRLVGKNWFGGETADNYSPFSPFVFARAQYVSFISNKTAYSKLFVYKHETCINLLKPSGFFSYRQV